MSRLINADEIKIRLPFALPPYNMMLLRNSIRQGIQDTPTVDAEPVRHGHWTVDKWSDDAIMRTEFTCSACGVQFVAAGDANISVFEYCPHCGRKMDEEADDDE